MINNSLSLARDFVTLKFLQDNVQPRNHTFPGNRPIEIGFGPFSEDLQENNILRLFVYDKGKL